MSLSRTLAKYIIEGKATFDDVLALLTQYKMLALLKNIHTELIELSKSSQKKELIHIETPFQLSEDSLQKIKAMMGKENTKHEVVINKNILSGFRATCDGLVYDASGARIIKEFINQ